MTYVHAQGDAGENKARHAGPGSRASSPGPRAVARMQSRGVAAGTLTAHSPLVHQLLSITVYELHRRRECGVAPGGPRGKEREVET